MAILPQLATFAATADVPPHVVDDVRRRVLDILGLCVAATVLDTSEQVRRFVDAQGGARRATAIGQRTKVSVPSAAFVNGVLAHSLDYDDTHLPSVLHPSASVVPAVLATAEGFDASGAAACDAIAIALEVCVRLGLAGYDERTRSNVFFDRGQHATSICGTVASAAGAGRARGLDEERLGHAMAIAASMASGIIEANRNGGTVKRLHCGWAAQAGVTAAALAAEGVTGPPTALDGRFGMFRAFLGDDARTDVVLDRLGEHWELLRIFFKPYPANHFTHAIADAAKALRAGGMTPDDIARVTIGVATEIVRSIGEPIELKREPRTGYQAQFSAPYVFAAALCTDVTRASFERDAVLDPARRELMQRVDVAADPWCDSIYPFQFPANVCVRTRDGDEVVQRVAVNWGGPGNPMSAEDLATKFDDNVAGLLDSARAERLRRLVGNLDRQRSVTPVLRLLAWAPRVHDAGGEG